LPPLWVWVTSFAVTLLVSRASHVAERHALVGVAAALTLLHVVHRDIAGARATPPRRADPRTLPGCIAGLGLGEIVHGDVAASLAIVVADVADLRAAVAALRLGGVVQIECSTFCAKAPPNAVEAITARAILPIMMFPFLW